MNHELAIEILEKQLDDYLKWKKYFSTRRDDKDYSTYKYEISSLRESIQVLKDKQKENGT